MTERTPDHDATRGASLLPKTICKRDANGEAAVKSVASDGRIRSQIRAWLLVLSVASRGKAKSQKAIKYHGSVK